MDIEVIWYALSQMASFQRIMQRQETRVCA